MPNIPLVQAGERIRIGAPDTTASAEQMGAGIGRALENLGDQITDFGSTIASVRKQKEGLDAATAVAGMDYTGRYLDNLKGANSDGAGFAENVKSDYGNWVEEQVGTIANDRVRDRVRKDLLARERTVIATAEQEEYKLLQTDTKDKINTSLAAVTNKVRATPEVYDVELQNAMGVIDAAPGWNANDKNSAKRVQTSVLAKARFEGLFDSAETPEQVEQIGKDLQSEKWRGSLTSEHYDALMGNLNAAQNTIETAKKSEVTVIMADLTQRNVSDPNKLIPVEDLQSAKQYVDKYGTPGQVENFYKIVKQQQFYQNQRGTPLPLLLQQRQNDVPAQQAGDVAGRIIQIESGGNPNAKNPESSASGLGQFTTGTWVSTVKAHEPGLFKGRTMQQVLDLRFDAATSKRMLQYHIDDNRRFLAARGRPTTPGALYLAHFAGAGGAAALLGSNSNTPVISVLGAAAVNANPTILRGKTVGQVIAWADAKMAGGKTYSAGDFAEAEARDNVIAAQQKAFGPNGDMMTYAFNAGTPGVTLGELNSMEAFQLRGVEAAKVADMNGIPNESATPLTEGEVQQFTQVMSNGDANEVTQMFAQLGALGPNMQTAALRQIGAKEPVYGYAGMLYDQETAGTSASIVRGYKQMDTAEKRDATFKRLKGGTIVDFDEQFYETAGNAVALMDQDQVAAARTAATAFYADRYGTQAYSADNYAKSVREVLGSQTSIGPVNGEPTLVPRGVTPEEMDNAVNSLDDGDLVTLSETGRPPMYMNGDPVTSDDIASEGNFRALDDEGTYAIEMGDFTLLTTGAMTPDGQLETYRIRLDKPAVQMLTKRMNSYGTQPGVITEIEPAGPGVHGVMPKTLDQIIQDGPQP